MRIRVLTIAVLAIFFIGIPIIGSANPNECKDWVAKIVSVEGRVESLKAGETDWHEVQTNNTYCPEDKIRTQEKSRVALLLPNETILRLDQKTTVKFSAPKKSTLLEILTGRAFFMSRTPQAFTIETPFVNAASEGTEFMIEVNEEARSATVTVIEGKMAVTNEAGSIAVKSGQEAMIKAGQSPILRILVRPADAIQWALYYPPVLSIRELKLDMAEGLPEGDWRLMVRRSIGFYMDGDIERAFSAIKKLHEEIRDERFFVYKASLLLSVGRVDEAGQDLQKALDLVPGYSPALALHSIISVAQNEKERALDLALKATRAGPDSVSAKIALSYAYQANFNLPEASAAIKEAVRLDPQGSLAWARLAELLMSEGDLDNALDAAKKAVAQNPKEARAQMVLGFAYLAQIKTKESRAAFEKAITLSQAEPLSRLGLGLAKIREGDLEEGRKEIEIAASLDPNNSLIRSYLGKAYYEEKRDKVAGIQLDMAKELDPKDPTPYLYDAIRKQTENRPVEALHDLQKSIELNDNRAVYRSRLLLDEDLAARSASLGRIFRDLGFEQLALVEGWKSVNTDPSNYSAHRFLADTYSVLPRHEVARVSELLQSQLLQSINITPVQPELAESNFFVLESAGPSALAFNEFNPLFNRNRYSLQTSGVFGSNSTLGEEFILSGVQGWISYSIGEFRFKTDGFRDNNDLEQDVYNIFMQARPFYETSIQVEARIRDTEKGDIPLLFDPENFNPSSRLTERVDSVRFGINQTLATNSRLIGSAIYQDADQIFDMPQVIGFDTNLDLFSLEIQHIFQPKKLNIISGARYTTADGPSTVTIPESEPETTDLDDHYSNLYVYLHSEHIRTLTLVFGGSVDFIESKGFMEAEQFNPKLGLILEPFPGSTIRAAAFRTLQRPLTSKQNILPSIEPTQVAGFNQFFFGGIGEDVWRYGLAIDQKLSSDLYTGLEFSTRNLDVPFIDSFDPALPVRIADWEESLGRAYIYWTLHPRLALGAEYLYELFKREKLFLDGIAELRTHRLPLAIDYFHQSGTRARLIATFVSQKGEFEDSLTGTIIPGQDEFWVLDSSVSYRLPKRYGVITLEVKNLLDREFQFQDSDPENPQIFPERFTLLKITLVF